MAVILILLLAVVISATEEGTQEAGVKCNEVAFTAAAGFPFSNQQVIQEGCNITIVYEISQNDFRMEWIKSIKDVSIPFATWDSEATPQLAYQNTKELNFSPGTVVQIDNKSFALRFSNFNQNSIGQYITKTYTVGKSEVLERNTFLAHNSTTVPTTEAEEESVTVSLIPPIVRQKNNSFVKVFCNSTLPNSTTYWRETESLKTVSHTNYMFFYFDSNKGDDLHNFFSCVTFNSVTATVATLGVGISRRSQLSNLVVSLIGGICGLVFFVILFFLFLPCYHCYSQKKKPPKKEEHEEEYAAIPLK